MSAPSCGASVKAMSSRSGGRNPAARSGHSSSTTVPSGRSSKPSSASSRAARQPVEIGMHERETRQLVGLHQREGRARHLDAVVAGEIADQRARERGLAGAEIAGQRHQVAGLERSGDVHRRSRTRRRLVRQRHGEACAAGGGRKHRRAPLISATPSASRGRCSSGKVQVTVVPWPDDGSRSSPCRRAARRTSAPAKGRARCRDGASRANGSRTSRTPAPAPRAECPGPWSVTENTTASGAPLGRAA